MIYYSNNQLFFKQFVYLFSVLSSLVVHDGQLHQKKKSSIQPFFVGVSAVSMADWHKITSEDGADIAAPNNDSMFNSSNVSGVLKSFYFISYELQIQKWIR